MLNYRILEFAAGDKAVRLWKSVKGVNLVKNETIALK
jgi:hypothetical protein